ncbi:hypothetical protein N431DRAFT_468415 [Stipitochalara longipes BDJ]|nr:hypothetical protein N431DRAFT_468415 [Stipitochalara longipes BDJ]
MAEQRRFEPQWPAEPNGPNGLYYPDDIDDRTPHPKIVPQEVLDLITRITAESIYTVFNNSDATFKLFPKLPVELRQIIWRYSLPGPRVVAVFCWSNVEHAFCKSTSPIPTALHVNKEARSVALQSYKARFSISSDPAKPAKIYFDSEIDSLYLGVGNFSPSGPDPIASFLRLLHPRDLKSITNLIMDADIEALYPDEDDVYPGLMSLGLNRLESVTIVSKAKRYDKDIIFHKSESVTGEFHAWEVSKQGRATPWRLPRDATCWEATLSAMWADIEENSFERSPSIKTAAYVSWNTLQRLPRWAARIRFLKRTVFVGEQACLYMKDGVIERLVELNLDVNPAKYDELTDIINVGFEGSERLDPLDVYVTRQACMCCIRHEQRISLPEGLSHEFLATVDLKGALAMLDHSQST